MKSVLLYANHDAGLEARLQAALDVVRLFGGHLTCLQVTPYNSFVMGDPFGGIYALPSVALQIAEADDEHRRAVEERLRREDVSWEWSHFDGGPAQLIVGQSRLSDLVVLSLPAGNDTDELAIAADVALHGRVPVLAVPQASRGFDGFGPALVAWNGSAEAVNALRLALPLLAKASLVSIVTVQEKSSDFPPTDASEYLSRHGISSEVNERPQGDISTAAALIEAAEELGASYILMGAYGHSRIREAVLGGVTRDLLQGSPFPLLLGH